MKPNTTEPTPCSAEVFLEEFENWMLRRNYFWRVWRCWTNWRDWRRAIILFQASLILGYRDKGLMLETEACLILAKLFSYPHRLPEGTNK